MPSRERRFAGDVVNVKGGAYAHGQPVGAVLATRPRHAMRRDGFERGAVTQRVGGGQGIALAPERVA